MAKRIKKRDYKRIFGGVVTTRILLGAILVIIASLFVDLTLIIFLLLIAIFNAQLAMFQLKKGMPTDFELSTFATVLLTQAYGLKVGLFVAFFTKLLASIYCGYVIVDHFIMIGLYCLAAIIASIFPGAPVFMLGLGIITINNILMFLISRKVLGLDMTSNLAYTATNFLFNLAVFSIFGEIARSFLP